MSNHKLVFNIHFLGLWQVLFRSQINIHPEKMDPISYFAKAKWYVKGKQQKNKTKTNVVKASKHQVDKNITYALSK